MLNSYEILAGAIITLGTILIASFLHTGSKDKILADPKPAPSLPPDPTVAGDKDALIQKNPAKITPSQLEKLAEATDFWRDLEKILTGEVNQLTHQVLGTFREERVRILRGERASTLHFLLTAYNFKTIEIPLAYSKIRKIPRRKSLFPTKYSRSQPLEHLAELSEVSVGDLSVADEEFYTALTFGELQRPVYYTKRQRPKLVQETNCVYLSIAPSRWKKSSR